MGLHDFSRKPPSYPMLDTDESEPPKDTRPTARPRDADSAQIQLKIRLGKMGDPDAERPRAHGIRPRKSAFIRDSQRDLQEELDHTDKEIEELRKKLQEQLEKRELLVMSLSL